MSRIDERNQIREDIFLARIPANVDLAVEIYEQQRNDPTCVISRYVEALGEAASCLITVIKGNENKPYNCVECKFFGRNKKGHSHTCRSVPIVDGSCFKRDHSTIQLYRELVNESNGN